MSVKCLGKPTIPKEIRIRTWVPRPNYGEQNSKEKTEHIIFSPRYLELRGKQYSPITGKGEIDKSKNSCVNAIRRSKKEPQLAGEIKTVGGGEKVNDSTFLRLWLYDGKIYEVDRNDYDRKQVKHLILDFLEREKRKFQKLERKYEVTKQANTS